MPDQDFINEKKEIALTGKIRDFVFGMQDGMISTLGLLCGVQGATDNSKTVIITGVAAMFTGALSMATGAYLSTQVEKEIFEKELKDQERYIEKHPSESHQELLEALHQEGLPHESSFRIVKIFGRHKIAFLKTFQEKVMGLNAADVSRPFISAIVIFISFVVGAVFPIFPYFVVNVDSAFWYSIGLSGFALFLVGVLKGHFARKSKLRGGMEFLLVALGSAAVGWLVGHFLAPGASQL